MQNRDRRNIKTTVKNTILAVSILPAFIIADILYDLALIFDMPVLFLPASIALFATLYLIHIVRKRLDAFDDYHLRARNIPERLDNDPDVR